MRRGRNRYRGFVVDLGCFAPYYLGELCAALSRTGYPVRGVSPRFALEPDYFETISPEVTSGVAGLTKRVRLRPELLHRGLSALEYLWNLSGFTIRWLLDPPDFVHFQWLPLLQNSSVQLELRILRLLRRRGVRVLLTVHNLLPHDTDDRYREAFSKAYRIADGLIVHTDHGRDELISSFGITGSKIFRIPHGPLLMEVPRSGGLWPQIVPSDAPYVLFAGQIRPYKGLEFLVDAWRSVAEEVPEARLVIAGRGSDDYVSSLQERVKTDRDSIIWSLGFVSKQDLVSLHAHAQILVYPYRDITQSGALMTGLSFGKPIVGTNVGGIAEVVTHGENGFLVDYGDVNGLADSLKVLLEDREARARMGKANSLRSEFDFNWEKIAGLTIESYEAVTALP